MKNLYIILIVLSGLLYFSQDISAQEGYAFQQGDVVINAGIGLGTTFAFTGTLGLPFGGGVEYGITDAIGVGGDIGFLSGNNINVLYITAKGSYHFNELLNIEDNKWDIYGGLSLHYRNFSFSIANYKAPGAIQLGLH